MKQTNNKVRAIELYMTALAKPEQQVSEQDISLFVDNAMTDKERRIFMRTLAHSVDGISMLADSARTPKENRWMRVYYRCSEWLLAPFSQKERWQAGFASILVAIVALNVFIPDDNGKNLPYTLDKGLEQPIAPPLSNTTDNATLLTQEKGVEIEDYETQLLVKAGSECQQNSMTEQRMLALSTAISLLREKSNKSLPNTKSVTDFCNWIDEVSE
ncbi:MAG: hypothetical protein ABJH06_13895 [Paraglaciecola sp.]|uniref:hypothetical protein n=1 Tax=Paraglaciecola sp. TaxID=1920173 RepID=UPI003298D518